MTEDWRFSPSFPDYEVSSLGRVRSHRRAGLVKAMKPSPDTKGRLQVSLTLPDGSRKRTIGVHRLVAEAFLGPKPQGQVIRHLDGNASNNSLANLSYGTRSENTYDSIDHRTHPPLKLTPEAVAEIRVAYANGRYTQRQLAEAYGVTQSNIHLVVTGKTWEDESR